jgi:hypothetical protein
MKIIIDSNELSSLIDSISRFDKLEIKIESLTEKISELSHQIHNVQQRVDEITTVTLKYEKKS